MHNTANRTKTQALAIYLFWLRKGLDQNTMGEIFGFEHWQSISNICEQVRDAMLKDFMPKYLGIDHLTREQWVSQNTEMVNELFDFDNNQLAFVADGTYLYCQKSSNYHFQRKTYSPHKKQNLVKPFVLCATNGKIADVFGLYAATDNDATIFNSILKNDGKLQNLLKDDDHIILDRGFLNSVKNLRVLKLKPKLPACKY